MKMENLLPVGSIVLLKESDKRLMIYGIFQREENDDKIYDYIGVPYPEGFIDIETCFLFNEELIDQILFLGYIDSEFQLFKNKLGQLIEESSL